MKILWANRYCLFDTSSGASISAREILLELARLGHDVTVLGATVFDSPAGSALINNAIAKHDASQKKTITIQDDGFKHHLIVTKSTSAGLMSLDELNLLYAHYRKLLAEFKPDVVLFYGGNSFDMLLPIEARKHGALTAAYLVNANYVGERWSEDIDLIFTDSRATSKFYKDKVGLNVVSIGTVIDPTRIVAASRNPERITFINPSLSKGAAIVVQLASFMEDRRPEIIFEVVESRGSWSELVKSVLGQDHILRNVVVSPNTNNMAEVYARSRILLAPSLWWESGARVLAEAALNGIPQITTDHGGSPEMVGDGGIIVRLPSIMHQAPYDKLLSQDMVEKFSGIIEELFDNNAKYQAISDRARQVSVRKHNKEANIRALEAALIALSSCRNRVHKSRTIENLPNTSSGLGSPALIDAKRRKVFCVGLNKTGTTSFARAMVQCGFRHLDYSKELLVRYKSDGWRAISESLNKFDSFSDWPFPLVYKDAFAEYGEDALYVLTVRETSDVWFQSISRHSLRIEPAASVRSLVYPCDYPDNDPVGYKQYYDSHNFEVKHFFAQHCPQNFIELCFDRGDGWKKLCEFIGVAEPIGDFPHLNKSSGLLDSRFLAEHKRLRDAERRRLKRAKVKV